MLHLLIACCLFAHVFLSLCVLFFLSLLITIIFISASLPLFFFFASAYTGVSRVFYYTSLHSRHPYTKTQEVHDLQSFACRIQLQLITFAMTFVGAGAGSFRARAINFHSAILSSMGGRFRQRAAFLREMGIDLKNAAAKLQLATRPLPVCPRAPSGHPSGVPFRWINPSRLSFAIPIS